MTQTRRLLNTKQDVREAVRHDPLPQIAGTGPKRRGGCTDIQEFALISWERCVRKSSCGPEGLPELRYSLGNFNNHDNDNDDDDNDEHWGVLA
jgi:hypothetical protein